MDVYATIKGQGGIPGLTTYPGSTDPDKQAAHAECLKLEKDGKIYRHVDNDGVTHGHGAPFIIWLPTASTAGDEHEAP